MIKQVSSLKFKMRFLKFYILFGMIGLLIEFITRYFLLQTIDNDFFATVIGIALGIFFAYWSNVKFNFQIPRYRINKALLLFVLIGVLSKLLQNYISNFLGLGFLAYEFERILTAGIIFMLFYIINVQFTFYNRTRLGIAIYSDIEENVDDIYKKVGQSPDFIQIDLVDETIYKNAKEVDLNIIKKVREYWPEKEIELHLMSLNADYWIKKLDYLKDNLNLIIFHEDVFQEIYNNLKGIKKSYNIGIFFENRTPLEEIKKYTEICNHITIMGIENLGYSGQKFSDNTLFKIDKIDKFKNRSKFNLEVDGGIDSTNFYKLKVDKLVSGSSVLTSNNSINKVMEFKRL